MKWKAPGMYARMTAAGTLDGEAERVGDEAMARLSDGKARAAAAEGLYKVEDLFKRAARLNQIDASLREQIIADFVKFPGEDPT
jgi:hypothetical protein